MADRLVTHDGNRILYDWKAILDQDEVWIDADGKVHRVGDMSALYRRCVFAYLVRTHGRDLLSRTIEQYMSGPRPSGDAAQDMFDNEFDELIRMTPGQYIARCPLGEALLEGQPDGDDVP